VPEASFDAPVASFVVPAASWFMPETSCVVPSAAVVAPSASWRSPDETVPAIVPAPFASSASVAPSSAIVLASVAAFVSASWALVTRTSTSSTYEAVMSCAVAVPIAAVTARATVPSVYPDPSSVDTWSVAFGAVPVVSVRMAATDREKSAGTVSTAA
jgi:hypothetical protein